MWYFLLVALLAAGIVILVCRRRGAVRGLALSVLSIVVGVMFAPVIVGNTMSKGLLLSKAWRNVLSQKEWRECANSRN